MAAIIVSYEQLAKGKNEGLDLEALVLFSGDSK